MIKTEFLEDFKSEKILDYEAAAKKIAELKKAGKTVGLCHGGFDLLHPGHVKHFESAKKLCDVLIVSVTSDRFVSSRKGTGRPVFQDSLRAYMIANLELVDYVVISDFEKGVDIIKLLKPSFYIKGPDYIGKTTPGITAEREAINAAGGEIKYTTDATMSTTEIIQYIKNELDIENVLLCIDRDGTLIRNNDFFGRNENWKEELQFNNDVINFLIYLQTKYRTVKLVITNQAGVARRFFDCKRVEEINQHINSELASRGLKIDGWEYCPFVDSAYASKHPELNPNPQYVREKTKRKPNTDMATDGLKKINKNLEEFSKIIVIGDREEDKLLAENLKAMFVDVKDKGYEELTREFKNV